MSDIVLQPSMWYAATAQHDDNPDCPNTGKMFEFNPLYSNADGDPRIRCGICQHAMTLLTATLLDPQPEFS
jgi:hypothetical protein